MNYEAAKLSRNLAENCRFRGTASISTSRGIFLYFTVDLESPPKLPLTLGGYGPPPNAWFTGPTRVLAPNAPRSVQLF